MSEEIDYYALVWDAVYEALKHESMESVEDAVDSAVEAYLEEYPS